MADDENGRIGGNSYLAIAYEAIWLSRKPLTPLQMLSLAKERGFLPAHLTGRTMHKTLSARLAEHIRERSEKSLFYRTAPGTFFVHSLASDKSLPDEYKSVFVGNLRAKTIRKENVLVAPRSALKGRIYGDFVPFDKVYFDDLFKSHCVFVDRASAEVNHDVKQFVTFTLVVHETKILVHKRGKFSTASDELKGQLSVGFGGHVSDEDFTLFSLGSDAFRANAARELREELFLDEYYNSIAETRHRADVVGYINVDDSEDARHHIAVLVIFKHKSPNLPRKGELSINALKWIDIENRLNDLSQYDLWSSMILENIYQGKISIKS